MTPRAERITCECLMSFRPMGQLDWAQGMTVNISPSGVLFRSSERVGVNILVQMTYVLPKQIPGRGGEVVSCKGKVVRISPPTVNDCQAHMGARILDYDP